MGCEPHLQTGPVQISCGHLEDRSLGLVNRRLEKEGLLVALFHHQPVEE
jgi:hypothetical protein